MRISPCSVKFFKKTKSFKCGGFVVSDLTLGFSLFSALQARRVGGALDKNPVGAGPEPGCLLGPLGAGGVVEASGASPEQDVLQQSQVAWTRPWWDDLQHHGATGWARPSGHQECLQADRETFGLGTPATSTFAWEAQAPAWFLTKL